MTWLAVGLIVWFVLSLIVGLLLGPHLRRESERQYPEDKP